MNNLLQKLYLADCITIQLQTTKEQFANELSAITDRGGTGLFSDPFESFVFSKYEFRGYVSEEGFEIRRRRKLFDTNSNNATVATGSFTEENGVLSVITEVNGFPVFYLILYILIAIIYFLILLALVTSDSDAKIFVASFLIIQAVLIYGISYFILRRGVARFTYELEREFFYLSKQEISL